MWQSCQISWLGPTQRVALSVALASQSLCARWKCAHLRKGIVWRLTCGQGEHGMSGIVFPDFMHRQSGMRLSIDGKLCSMRRLRLHATTIWSSVGLLLATSTSNYVKLTHSLTYSTQSTLLKILRLRSNGSMIPLTAKIGLFCNGLAQD